MHNYVCPTLHRNKLHDKYVLRLFPCITVLACCEVLLLDFRCKLGWSRYLFLFTSFLIIGFEKQGSAFWVLVLVFSIFASHGTNFLNSLSHLVRIPGTNTSLLLGLHGDSQNRSWLFCNCVMLTPHCISPPHPTPPTPPPLYFVPALTTMLTVQNLYMALCY